MGGSAWGPVFTPLVAVIGAVVTIRRRRASGREAAEIWLLWIFGMVTGIGGLVVTVSHVFFADFTAQQIGFPTGNPFQFEVAMANFAFAVLGLLCLKFRGAFWLATGIGFSVFYLGAAGGHVYQLVAHGNTAPYNAGPILYTDFAIPIALLVLLWFWARGNSAVVTGDKKVNRWHPAATSEADRPAGGGGSTTASTAAGRSADPAAPVARRSD